MCLYRKIDDAGLHISVATSAEMTLPVDNIIVCAGQDPNRELQAALEAKGVRVHLIGGADKAAELDAKRAIKQGTELALRIDLSPAPAAAQKARPAYTQAPAAVQESPEGLARHGGSGRPERTAQHLAQEAVFRSPMRTPTPARRRCR